MKRISDDNRRAESKLWNSYRENEARERAIRKQLNKTQKMLAQAEAEVERLKKTHAKTDEVFQTVI